eukprot:TRINITY_DN7987_c0_g1_i1.p1 TRINITY_DN7987_c0_g1~~TRINITY_DN7987_c0_g1_i1.p1  ORF type:complete len:339 (+),score=5.45 TRINITY_DN7987_c0_g1_i1:32-1018(+)
MSKEGEGDGGESQPNFWGDMPEAEYYASQGVTNKKEYFRTPNGTIFTQTWAPLDQSAPTKGIVCVTHGYGSDTGWMFQKIPIAFAQWGYTVFGADLLGHGRSDGLRCYLGDMPKMASTSLLFFQSKRDSPAFKGLPHFLFGESMGGAITVLMYLQDPDGWDGLMFTAPLFVLPEAMKPSRWRMTAYGLLFGFADTWAVIPDNKMVKKAIKDPAKLKVIAANPRRYTGPPRVGTMRELLRVTDYFQREGLSKIEIPFLTVHGTSDEVTSPESSRLLYEKAKTREEDKKLILYEDMYHSLIQGEPDENSSRVLNDMRLWIDGQVHKLRNK